MPLLYLSFVVLEVLIFAYLLFIIYVHSNSDYLHIVSFIVQYLFMEVTILALSLLVAYLAEDEVVRKRRIIKLLVLPKMETIQ